MTDFKPISEDDLPLLAGFYRNCSYGLCEYSAGIKVFWNSEYPGFYSIDENTLFVRSEIAEGKCCFEFPVLSENGDLENAFDKIDSWCMENECRPLFIDIPQNKLPFLVKRYPMFTVSDDRNEQDYIYRYSDLSEFKGKHYSGQRNHIKKFKTLYPDCKFRKLSLSDNLEKFWAEYEKESSKTSEEALTELAIAKQMVKCSVKEQTVLFNGCLEVNGRIAALSVAENCGPYMIIHIEKALREYEGIYPVMVNEFAKYYRSEKIDFINREDDNGDMGLRTSKLQYRPAFLEKKICFEVKDKLSTLKKLPVIQTENLRIDRLNNTDSDSYQALCTDDELNKYWGYDYRKDIKSITPGCFLNMAFSDTELRTCVSLALRYNGLFIGEAVLYNSNFKGSIEIGCRILKQYRNKGLGTQALKAVSDWALYQAGFEKVCAKCFKENTASRKMLSKVMRQVSEDSDYCFFERIV